MQKPQKNKWPSFAIRAIEGHWKGNVVKKIKLERHRTDTFLENFDAIQEHRRGNATL
jgi:hypothetical protein